MNKVLRALQVGANALLESPTGTGKVQSHPICCKQYWTTPISQTWMWSKCRFRPWPCFALLWRGKSIKKISCSCRLQLAARKRKKPKHQRFISLHGTVVTWVLVLCFLVLFLAATSSIFQLFGLSFCIRGRTALLKEPILSSRKVHYVYYHQLCFMILPTSTWSWPSQSCWNNVKPRCKWCYFGQ